MVRLGQSSAIFREARTAPQSASDGYRRAARYLRHRLRDDPPRLLRSLRQLSAEVDSLAEKTATTFAGLPSQCRHSHAGQFAKLVAGRLEGPILRYSQRVALLRQAAILGIERFEANLIIAAVQHRAGNVEADRGSGRSRWAILALAAAVQAMIVAAAAIVLRGGG